MTDHNMLVVVCSGPYAESLCQPSCAVCGATYGPAPRRAALRQRDLVNVALHVGAAFLTSSSNSGGMSSSPVS